MIVIIVSLVFVGVVTHFICKRNNIYKAFEDLEEQVKATLPPEDYEKYYKGMKDDRYAYQALNRKWRYTLGKQIESQQEVFDLLVKKGKEIQNEKPMDFDR